MFIVQTTSGGSRDCRQGWRRSEVQLQAGSRYIAPTKRLHFLHVSQFRLHFCTWAFLVCERPCLLSVNVAYTVERTFTYPLDPPLNDISVELQFCCVHVAQTSYAAKNDCCHCQTVSYQSRWRAAPRFWKWGDNAEIFWPPPFFGQLGDKILLK